MAFTIFNSAIIKSTKHIKLQSFNEEAYEILKEANVCYEKISQYYLGLSGKSLNQHKEQLIKYIKQNNAKAFHLHLKMYQSDCKQVREQEAYLKQQKILNELNWEDIKKENNIYSSHILKIKKIWSKNKLSSYYTSEALHALSEIILPLFQHFNALASQELDCYKNKLSPKARQYLEDYVRLLSREIKQHQYLICDAMLSRLEIASKENNLQYDDVTHYVVKKLDSYGVSLSFNEKGRNGLTPSLFCHFHKYVTTKGNSDQNNKLKKLEWLKEDANFYSQLIDSQWVIIPRVMTKFNIPSTTKKKFTLWYSWHNWRANFFKQRFYQLVKIRRLEQNHYCKSQGLAELVEGCSWQALIQMENEINAENQTISQFVNSFLNKIFFPRKSDFLKNWQEVNNLFKKKIFDQKIQYALALAKELDTRLTFDLDTDVLTKEKTKETLLAIIANIEKNADQYASSLHLWPQIKKIYLSALNYSVKNPSQLKDVKHLNDNKTITVPSSFRIKEHKLNLPIKKNKIKENTWQLLNQHFVSLLKGNMFDFQLDNFNARLMDFKKYLSIPNRDIDYQELTIFWIKYFSCYLRSSLESKNPEAENFIELLDIILNFAPKNFKERALMLKENQHKQSIFVFRARCHALLFSFNENLALLQSECDKKVLTSLYDF